jgi:hypothetical protein
MISTHTKDFSWKKGPNLPSFEEKKSILLDFYEKLR